MLITSVFQHTSSPHQFHLMLYAINRLQDTKLDTNEHEMDVSTLIIKFRHLLVDYF
jgi:hypothetical protein